MKKARGNERVKGRGGGVSRLVSRHTSPRSAQLLSRFSPALFPSPSRKLTCSRAGGSINRRNARRGCLFSPSVSLIYSERHPTSHRRSRPLLLLLVYLSFFDKYLISLFFFAWTCLTLRVFYCLFFFFYHLDGTRTREKQRTRLVWAYIYF